MLDVVLELEVSTEWTAVYLHHGMEDHHTFSEEGEMDDYIQRRGRQLLMRTYRRTWHTQIDGVDARAVSGRLT